MERQVTNRRCLTMIAAVTIWSALFAGTGMAAQTHTAASGWGTVNLWICVRPKPSWRWLMWEA